MKEKKMQKSRIRIVRTISFLIVFAACSQNNTQDKEELYQKQIEDLMQADRDFSLLSEKEGMKKAFFTWADSSAVLLRPDVLPLKGLTDIKKYYENLNDSSFTLTWEPDTAFISKSGDLGYTYGIWIFKSSQESAKGTYVSIWKNDGEGWAYVLDTGNDGIGEE